MDMVSGGWAPCRGRGSSIRLSEWLFWTATSRRPLGVDISIPSQRSSAAPLAFNLSVLLAHFALQPPSSPCPRSGNPCPIPGTIICASTPEPPVWTKIKFAVICCDRNADNAQARAFLGGICQQSHCESSCYWVMNPSQGSNFHCNKFSRLGICLLDCGRFAIGDHAETAEIPCPTKSRPKSCCLTLTK
jgi:hypothetical protein